MLYIIMTCTHLQWLGCIKNGIPHCGMMITSLLPNYYHIIVITII